MDQKINTGKLKYLLGHTYSMWSFPNAGYICFITPVMVMTQVIRTYLNNVLPRGRMSVWDVFAGIGTDAVAFSKFAIFSRIVATEINEVTFSHMTRNVAAFRAGSIECVNADATAFPMPDVDIIYFDPPWGETFKSGRDFSFDEVALPNGVKIMELLERFKATGKAMIIKSPLLCKSFETAFPHERVSHVLTFSQQKLKFIFIKALLGN